MQASPKLYPQVVIDNPGRDLLANDGYKRKLRPLSVDEALQYSPFTTSPSVGHDRIPVPELGHVQTSRSLTTLAERKAVRRKLQQISQNLDNQHEGESIQEVGRKLEMLLDSDKLPQYKFKAPNLQYGEPCSTKDEPINMQALGVSSFAKMVLDSTDITYRYVDPKTPSPKTMQAHSLLTPAISASPDRTATDQNLPAFKQNSSIRQLGISAHPVSRQQPVVVVPPLPPGSQSSDYEFIHDSPKRRKLDNNFQSERVALHVRAQREEANAALLKFQDLMVQIFEEQDRFAPNASNGTTIQDTQFFEPSEDIDESNIILKTKVQSKLQNSIKKLVGYGRFGDISTDDIRRLQKICESPLRAAQTINLKLDDYAGETDLWRDKVQAADNGATSACTVIWTILGSLQNKELCPEDIIQDLPVILTNIFETCLIPVIEARSSGRYAELFQNALDSKDLLTRLLYQGKKLLDLLAALCVHPEGAAGLATATEFLAVKLIFVENSHNEKESALGFQTFEAVRKTAMEVLTKIFARFPEDRKGILAEILGSLDKLPSTNRAARQFKLIDGKNIQLLSALVMQLVQTTSPASPSRTQAGKTISVKTNGNVEMNREDSDDDGDDRDEPRNVESNNEDGEDLVSLKQRVSAPIKDCTERAESIIRFFVHRAMTSTKTGDEPYRNLLDLFTEDLINVLGSTDWPASELLLNILAVHMINIVRDEKSGGNAKNMALELLGWMGSAIANLRASVRSLAAANHEIDSVLSQRLERLADDQARGGLQIEDIVAGDGPYQTIVDYLRSRSTNDWQLKNAEKFFILQWAKTASSILGEENEGSSDAKLAVLLHSLISDAAWLTQEKGPEEISANQARLSYAIITLSKDFCKLFDFIVGSLLSSITSDQAKIRSRSLKSVISLFETDPSLLDRNTSFQDVIFRCASDQSPMVRDSALSLIAKCMSLKPSLEEDSCKVILACAVDPTVGVRKRCIGLLKDIYLRDTRLDLKVAISRSMLERTLDHEDIVSSLAQQSLIELWFAHLVSLSSHGTDTVRMQVAISEQTSVMIQTTSLGPEVLLPPLERFLKRALKADSKDAKALDDVCQRIVAVLFERILNWEDNNNKESRAGLLSTLLAFSKVRAKLVVPEQLRALQPYVSNLTPKDDLTLFRSVVFIYRCVLPHLSASQQALLADIQNDLFKTISRLGRAELNEVMSCLWTISGVLPNTNDRLVKLMISVLRGLHQTRVPDNGKDISSFTQQELDQLTRLRSYVRIAGAVIRHCDLEKNYPHFKQALFFWTGNSVAGATTDLICPLALPGNENSLRVMAFDSLGGICQSWPGQFSKESVQKAFSIVFTEDSPALQSSCLRTFADFFGVRESWSEPPTDSSNEERDKDLGRLGGSLKASDYDGAAALIAQHFLEPMIRIAMGSENTNALISIKVIASINRQGLIHPKQSAGVLVALETSNVAEIAETALESHRLMHQQHETMFEREYMRAVHEAFIYQKDIVGDSLGATQRPYQPKLGRLYEVVKTSNTKYVKKFISNLVSKTSFDLATIDISDPIPNHVVFTRFIVQNLAYFEYGRLDELAHAVLQLENVVGKAGADVAQAIETQVAGATTLTPPEGEADVVNGTQLVDLAWMGASESPVANPTNLKRLVTAAMILMMLWETRTHLRRLYGITQDVRQILGKGSDSKEISKAPAKIPGVTGERFWDNVVMMMMSLDSPEAMVGRCQEFTTLMNIDEEVKVAAGEDDMREAYSASVGPDEEPLNLGAGNKMARFSKRKSTASANSTPRKKRSRPGAKGRRRSSMSMDEEDGNWD